MSPQDFMKTRPASAAFMNSTIVSLKASGDTSCTKWFGAEMMTCRPFVALAPISATASNVGFQPPVMKRTGIRASDTIFAALRIASPEAMRACNRLHPSAFAVSASGSSPAFIGSESVCETTPKSRASVSAYSAGVRVLSHASPMRRKSSRAGALRLMTSLPGRSGINAGSIRMRERTADGLRAAASKATAPPNEWPTRWAPSPRDAATQRESASISSGPRVGLSPKPGRSGTSNCQPRCASTFCSRNVAGPPPSPPCTPP